MVVFIPRKEILPLVRPSIGDEEIEEVAKTLRDGWITTGQKTALFEKRFATHVGAKYAVAVTNGTAALYLALKAAGIGPGDEVITSPLTFCATANAIELAGAKVVFADVLEETGTIDPCLAGQLISERTRAIIPVHLHGQPCDLDPLTEIAQNNDLRLIQDAAHCVSGSYRGRKLGSMGDANCYSFYASKNLTTGEGGMISSNSDEITEEARLLRYHGLRVDGPRWKRQGRNPRLVRPGFNFVMTDLAASIGLHQLKRLAYEQRQRRRLWNWYVNELGPVEGIRVPTIVKFTTEHGMHHFHVELETVNLGCSRDSFLQELKNLNICAVVHYPVLHMESYYRDKYGYKMGDFPVAETIAETTISLPFYGGMKEQDLLDVTRTIQYIMDQHRGSKSTT